MSKFRLRAIDILIYCDSTLVMDRIAATHLPHQALQQYSLSKHGEVSFAAVEEHLLVCDFCRAALEAIEPVNYVHFTSDGAIYCRATLLTTSRVSARHWGKALDGGKEFGSVAAARRYLHRSFAQMFPEHKCTDRCGPTQERGESLGL